MSKSPKIYAVSEDEIERISGLFGMLEDAVKELIRNSKANEQMAGMTELDFYESTSRTLYECDQGLEAKTIDLDSIF